MSKFSGKRTVTGQNTGKLYTNDLIKIKTRHYAKRQMTWFKNKIKNIEWIDIDEYDEDEVISKIIARITEKS